MACTRPDGRAEIIVVCRFDFNAPCQDSRRSALRNARRQREGVKSAQSVAEMRPFYQGRERRMLFRAELGREREGEKERTTKQQDITQHFPYLDFQI
jgi:hypothetical protein